MLRRFGTTVVEQPTASRAHVAMRLLTEFRHVAAVDVIKTVSDCDRQWPAEPGHVIEHAARSRLLASA